MAGTLYAIDCYKQVINSIANQYITKKLDWVEREEEGEDKLYIPQKSFSIFLNFLITFIFSFLIIELYLCWKVPLRGPSSQVVVESIGFLK